jgi:hypothetical protein
VASRPALPPIVLIGMHRSGTSVVSRLLEGLGLFVGKKKDENNEAMFFLDLNNWLLRQSGASWDHPEPVRHLLTNPRARALTVDYMSHLIKTPPVAAYMGWRRFLRYRTPSRLNVPWGWKDPRNTYTLPFWLDLFPEARVISVRRHGVDVAGSLRVREDKTLNLAEALHERRRRLYALHPKRGGFMDSPRCASMEGGFSLWEAYITEAQGHVERLGDQAMELRYEDLLTEPGPALASLARFCGLPTTDSAIADVSRKLRKDRAYAYLNRPELREFAERVAGRLAAKGY